MAQFMFDGIIEGLKLTKCPLQPPDIPSLKKALGGTMCSKLYAQVIVWVSTELCSVSPIGEAITMPCGPTEEPIFRVELSSLLTDLECPAPGLGGAESLTDPNNRTSALYFLIHELMSSQIGTVNKSTKTQVNTKTGCFSGHPALADLALIYHVLELPQPSASSTAQDIFDVAVKRILDITTGPRALSAGEPLLQTSLSPALCVQFEELCHTMNEEYTTRFSTLLKRLDLTITSFKWSKHAKDKCSEIDKVYLAQRSLMQSKTNLSIADVLAARTDLLLVGRTSSGAVRTNTKSNINNMVIVGKVPDRGGRPHEQRPEPEVPSWQKNNRGRGGHSQQSRGGKSQAAQGRQFQQQPRDNSHQERGERPYDRRGSASGRGTRGNSAARASASSYQRGSWGGYSRGSRGGGGGGSVY